MAKKGEEIKSKLDESEENTKSIENEISRKERQLKILDNKVRNLKFSWTVGSFIQANFLNH